MTIEEILTKALRWHGDYRRDLSLVLLASILDRSEPADWDWIVEGQDEIAAMRAAVAAGEALHVVPFLALVDMALRLPRNDRESLHERLETSLEEDPDWQPFDERTVRKIKRRLAELDARTVKTVPFDVALARARAAVQSVRRTRRK